MNAPEISAVEQALAALLRRCFSSLGLAVPAAFSRFSELARVHGATRLEGPLRHDLVLCHGSGSRALGLNFFRLPRAVAVETLLEIARSELALSPLTELEGLLGDLPPRVMLTPGIFFRDGQLSFKLYFDGGEARDLPELGARLGVATLPEARALAADFATAGFGRARQYLRLPPTSESGLAELSALGKLGERWLGCTRRSSAATHRLLALSNAAQSAAGKRSLVQTFAPGSRPSDVLGFERDLQADGVELGRRHTPEHLADLDQLLQTHGFRLGCVAHEVDVFESGTIDSDTFVTLTQPQA
jgi:hypothetical protein